MRTAVGAVGVVTASSIATAVLVVSLGTGRGAAAATQAVVPKSGELRAAAVKVDITPQQPMWLSGYGPRQSTGVLDKIYHRVVALDAGDAQFYLISSDLCLFSPRLYDEVMLDLQKQTGVDPKHVLWSVTHTHAAPEIGPPDMYKTLLGRSDHDWDREYTDQTTTALIDAVRQARQQLEPARLVVATGVAMANINRRAMDVDGRVSIGLNPDGPVDRQIGLIRITRPDGSPVALVVNYAMHGTVMSGQNVSISGDGPGVVTAYLEEKLGGTVLFVNSAAGNIAPIYSVYANERSGHLSQFRVLLGDRVISAVTSLGPGTAAVTIRHVETVVETARKEGLVWPEELSAYSGTQVRPTVRLPIRFVRINDAVIWSAPVELFCEIAMDVRQRSPFAHTLYFGYTNGWFGYLPTARGFAEGGYEPRTSPFTLQAETDLGSAVTTVIHGLRR